MRLILSPAVDYVFKLPSHPGSVAVTLVTLLKTNGYVHLSHCHSVTAAEHKEITSLPLPFSLK